MTGWLVALGVVAMVQLWVSALVCVWVWDLHDRVKAQDAYLHGVAIPALRAEIAKERCAPKKKGGAR